VGLKLRSPCPLGESPVIIDLLEGMQIGDSA